MQERPNESKSEYIPYTLDLPVDKNTHKPALYNGLINVHHDIKKIYELLDNGVIDPAIILENLLTGHLAKPKHSVISFLRGGQEHHVLAKKMLATLRPEEKSNDSTSDRLRSALRILNESQDKFTPNDKLIQLLNAFFSIYSVYFTHIDNAELIKSMRITKQEDIYFKTILTPQAKERLGNHELKLDSRVMVNTQINDEEIALLILTNQIEPMINFLIQHSHLHNSGIKPDNYKNGFTALESLVKIARQASSNVIEKTILPAILEDMIEDPTWETKKGPMYILLGIVTHKVSAESKKKIFAILGTAMQNKNHIARNYANDAFHEIAKHLDQSQSEQVEEFILPTFLQDTSHFRNYKKLADIARLTHQKTFDEKILPIIFEDLKSGYSSCGLRMVDMLQIMQFATEKYGKSSSQVDYLQAIDELQARLQKNLLNLIHSIKDEKNINSSIFDELIDMLLIIEPATLKEIILPFVLQHASNLDSRIRWTVYKTAENLAELPVEKFPLTERKKLIDSLLVQSKTEDVDNGTFHLYKALGKLIQHSSNGDLAIEAANKLLETVKFMKVKQGFKETLKSIHAGLYFKMNAEIESSLAKERVNEQTLQCLAEAMTALPPKFIQENILTKLQDVFTRINSVDVHRETFTVLNAAIKKAAMQDLKDIFPILFKASDQQSMAVEMQLISNLNEIISKSFSYPERVYCSRVLMKSFEAEWPNKHNNREYILRQVYIQNIQEISAAQALLTTLQPTETKPTSEEITIQPTLEFSFRKH